MDETVARSRDDEVEKSASREAYNAVTAISPVEMLPEDDPFGEVTAALVVGVDEDDKFHVVTTAPEDQRAMMTVCMEIVQDVLANFTEYKPIFEKRNVDAQGSREED